MFDMEILAALTAGLISAVSLPIGAGLGLALRPGHRVTAALMAFGAGALLFALTIEIVAPAFHEAGFLPLAAGCVMGGVAFELINQELNEHGGFLRKTATTARQFALKRREQTKGLLARLSHQPIFHALTPEQIAELAPMFEVRMVDAGRKIIAEGGVASAMYIIESGEVEVSRGDQIVTTLGPGDLVGELELVKDSPRVATVTAKTHLMLFRLAADDFRKLLETSPGTRDEVRQLVNTRTGVLQLADIVSQSKAREWKESAEELLIEAGRPPTRQELQHSAKSHGSAAVLGIWLGILLDGIPESLVIGTSVESFTALSWALVAGVFLANLPEAMSSSVIMRKQGYSKKRILLMWSSITVATGIGAVVGKAFFAGMSTGTFAVVEGAAAGAMLTMIAETMLPEAYENGGAVVGLSTLGGFLAALAVKAIA